MRFKYLNPEKEVEGRRPHNHCEQVANGVRHAKMHVVKIVSMILGEKKTGENTISTRNERNISHHVLIT